MERSVGDVPIYILIFVDGGNDPVVEYPSVGIATNAELIYVVADIFEDPL